MDDEFAFAQMLIGRLPVVLDALGAGTIDVHKARVFADYLAYLTTAQIAELCARSVPPAVRWTTGQLVARSAREVQAIDRDFYRRRYLRAIRDRGVCGYLTPDRTATMSAQGLSPSEAAAATERLERLADPRCRRDRFPGGFRTRRTVERRAWVDAGPGGPPPEPEAGPGPTRRSSPSRKLRRLDLPTPETSASADAATAHRPR
ncbi:DUF222 domain-containing protein [Pseudonocardia sp. H11422]|uniref:DUF222 domain-containing protein n=1 Tax=Pseudonocardia sp. H11422 TaxID=2835866 RepID=UPI001BDC63A6|nr:DUF222 domain-containing protein [Pseudonocardia sp. H11422]